MAEAADILEVGDLIPAGATGEGWDEEKISTYLDAGRTISETVRTYWEWKVANTYTLTDISESGSSRNLSKIHDNAVTQLQYWKGKVSEEEAEIDAAGSGRIAFHKVKRV